MKRYNVYLDEDDVRFLVEEYSSISLSEHIRRAMGQYIVTIFKKDISNSPSKKESEKK